MNSPTSLSRASLLVFLALSVLLIVSYPVYPGHATESAAPARTAITKVYAGQSVIHFSNPSADRTVSVNVEVWGVTDGTVLGTFQIKIPMMASVEVRPEEQLRTSAPINWDQWLVLYVSADGGAPVWQHLRRASVRGAWTNASICSYAASGAMPPSNLVLQATLTHMFSAPYSPYHSFISLHNASDAAAAFEALLFDAATGEFKGRVEVRLRARGSLHESAHWFQSGAQWYSPRPDQKAMNIRFVDETGADAKGTLVVGHMLMDVIDGGGTNLSYLCPINITPSSASK